MKPSPPLEQVVDGLDHVGRARELGALRLQQASKSLSSRALLSWRICSRCSVLSPWISRSISNSWSIRRTASTAIGEIAVAERPRRAFLAISASSKNALRPLVQQKAAVTGVGLRPGGEEGIEPAIGVRLEGPAKF